MRKYRRKASRLVSAGNPRSHRDRHDPFVDSRHHLHLDVLKRESPVFSFEKAKRLATEDLRRNDHGNRQRTYKTSGGRIARTEMRPQSQVHDTGLSVPVFSYFQHPRRVLVCIRRHNRRSVLFALRKIGKGRKVSPRHVWTDKSRVRCK